MTRTIFIFSITALSLVLFAQSTVSYALGTQPTDSTISTNTAPQNELPPIYFKKNDYNHLLERYEYLAALESAYLKASKGWEYWQAVANFAPYVGDTEGATLARTKCWINRPAEEGPIVESPLEGYKPVDAIPEILRKANKYNWVMVGEEHMEPQTRCLLLPLLRGLRAKGFRYFAAETFNQDLSETTKYGHTVHSTGYYTEDPVFAQAVNEALRLGYKLVPYEIPKEPAELANADRMKRTNYREMVQAKNLKERIFDRDPKGKVFVWAGRSHVSTGKGRDRDSNQEFVPMGLNFRELTGINPLSILLPAQTEFFSREKETLEYKFATSMGWIKRPTIFVNQKNGDAFRRSDDSDDIEVFFPRHKLVQGRADWLARDLDRAAVPIPKRCVAAKGLQLAQVFEQNHSENAVAIDRVLIKPGEPLPALMLPKHGNFILRITDNKGKVNGEAHLQT